MYKLILIAGTVFLAAGCANLGPVNEECKGANGPDIHIRYGDSKISVTKRVKVKSNGRLVLRMHPDAKWRSDKKVDYKNVKVELEGKDAASAWIKTELNANEKKSSKAVICVGKRSKGTYEYLVKVTGVGEIDPRVDIED